MNLKHKKGFTLAELIITAAITVIVIGAAATAMILGLNVFGAAANTVEQQRKIRLAEAAFKENVVIAESYNITAYDPAVPFSAGDRDIYLYYAGDDFVMQMGNTTVKTSGVDSVTVYFHEGDSLCSAEYVISTTGLDYRGVIVMNNIKTTASGTSCALSPGSTTALHMVIAVEE